MAAVRLEVVVVLIQHCEVISIEAVGQQGRFAAVSPSGVPVALIDR